MSKLPQRPRRAVRRVVALVVLVLAALSARTAGAATAFALTAANQIATFDTSVPGAALSAVAITGLQGGETPLAIDLRPATGQLYLLGSTSRLYVLNPVTGIAAAVGPAFTPALSGTSFGFDFNPVVDRIRVVSDTGQNLRLNPDTGAIVQADSNLNPGAPHVVGAAYSNNVAGALLTTLYVIDSTTDQLFIQVNPNGGTLQVVGNLGLNTNDLVGFDISANDNIAYATLTSTAPDISRLYRINLTVGLASLVGTFVAPIRDIAVLARGVPIVALRGNELIRFHSASPGTILGTATLSGLQLAEQLVGIDMRPANGQLYGIGSTGRFYHLDPISGVATQIGPVLSVALSGTRFGVDFNPSVDRLRLVSDAEQNLRIDPNTGSIAVVDTNLIPSTTVGGAAYLNNVDGAPTTVLYDIDAATDQLVRQGTTTPNDGVLHAVGLLGVNTSSDIAFDISPLDNTGFAALNVGGASSLYTINLTTGAATLVGTIGTGTVVNGLTAMPLTYQFAEGSTGAFFDTDLLLVNPTPISLPVTITYLTESGRVVTNGLTLAGESRTTVSADANAQLGATAFSSTVTSHLGIPIAAERTMRWDATGYGMHTEKAMPSLARDWFFAEGAQGFYDTFFLLTNPSPAANTATLRFFLENGTQVTHPVNLPPLSRVTVYAGSVPQLVNQAFGTSVSFTFAGAAERAMYFGSPVFSGGHESAGVTSTSTEWFLAEGATGSFFTTFVLLSNPNPTPANVILYYYREGGGFVPDGLTIPAGSRRTINIATVGPTLAATSVATRVTSDIGIVVERAMYWPMTPASWNEASNAFGVTETSRRWALAEGRVGGPSAFQTYVLIANPDTSPALVNATFARTSGAPFAKTFSVPANGRLTITTGPGSMVPELADESFGVILTADRPVFAERALYSNAGGVFWAAGSVATATAIP